MTTLRRPRKARGPTYQLAAHAFITPAIIFVVILLYIPFIWTAYISFTKFNGLGTPIWNGFANYIHIFTDVSMLTSMLNTLFWVIGTLILPVGLGLMIAVLASGVTGGAWFRLPFLIPYAISGISVGVIWTFVLQADGALTEAMHFLHLPGADARWLLDAPLNTIVMIIAHSWQASGVNALLFTIGLQSIPRDPIEAAQIDGAGSWAIFRKVTWPLLRPLTTVVVGLSLVGSLKTFDVIWGMTKGGPGRNSENLAVTMYKQTFVHNDYGVGAAVALLLTLMTVIAAALYLRRQLGTAREA